ncbi:hypothetical protein IQ260_04285 [Leptolyngbya cf. ectocarpi LEGE 11479]|uniref:Uncharacterized protein n=1 Tax=Leptolyngbya cf. ectocarpi LEGE 11479 TaxID=1828722 RepID=A0A928X1W8_LEPEC|nr:hypothetical protein [Leptolyngbya ectocarpi]MBE9065866.1 hypothetical protein [Leptolyngbya cf. ectocarpi LEGE 11479]
MGEVDIAEGLVQIFLVALALLSSLYILLVFLPLLLGSICKQKALGRYGSLSVFSILIFYAVWRLTAGDNLIDIFFGPWLEDRHVLFLSTSTSLGFMFFILLNHFFLKKN